MPQRHATRTRAVTRRPGRRHRAARRILPSLPVRSHVQWATQGAPLLLVRRHPRRSKGARRITRAPSPPASSPACARLTPGCAWRRACAPAPPLRRQNPPGWLWRLRYWQQSPCLRQRHLRRHRCRLRLRWPRVRVAGSAGAPGSGGSSSTWRPRSSRTCCARSSATGCS